MRKLFQFVFAAVLGSIITLAAYEKMALRPRARSIGDGLRRGGRKGRAAFRFGLTGVAGLILGGRDCLFAGVFAGFAFYGRWPGAAFATIIRDIKARTLENDAHRLNDPK